MSDFQTSLFGCLGDIEICLLGAFVPCYIGGRTKAKVDSRSFHWCDCCCWAPQVEYYTRQQIRSKYGYDHKEVLDSILLILCTHCILCQDAIEVKNH